MATEGKSGGMPKAGEAIDFTTHVLPFLKTVALVAIKNPTTKTDEPFNLKLVLP